MSEELPGQLFQLADEVLEELGSNTDLQKEEVPLIKENINIEYDGHSRSSQTEHEEIREIQWTRESYEILEEKLEDKNVYQRCLEKIADTKDVPENQAQIWLRKYIKEIMDRSLDSIQDPEIADLASVFSAEIQNNPVLWEPKIHLDGVTLEIEEMKFGDNILLRRPKGEDLGRKFDLRRIPINRRHPVRPSALLEFSTRAENNQKILNTSEQIITALRLYQVGSVKKLRTEYNPKGILNIAGESFTVDKGPTNFRYALEEEDKEGFEKFFDKINESISENLVEEDEGHISIAYDRYSDMLEKRGTHEKQISLAIMSLEALLLKEEERGELSERLSRRAAVIIGSFPNYEPIEVFNKLKKAYEIRSNYVHGSQIEDDDFGSELHKRIANYARLLLIVSLLQEEREGKEELLSKADNASLHEAARDSLKDYLPSLTFLKDV